ncbi:tetratricopeptide repeat protein [Streptomyces chartreusis]|uniref:tetratricopeptide repeat protein n=1 Tax=Streptomyces chartreusis TaxID=1969 RepID=UPI003793AAAB
MDAADAEVEATGTGNTTAASGATAVTGYRGPAPGNDGAPRAVRVSGTGDAIAFDGGLANAGYIHQVSVEQLTMVQQRVPQEPAPWPHQVGVIPSRARSFQHRAEADRLWAAVEGGGTAVLSQVLTGMGGVGKTQLAADYVRAAWEDGGLDVLVWVTASAQSPVVTGYAQAGIELCRADPDENPEQAAKEFLAWLTPKAGQRPCRWLIVLDDVADPDDLVVNPDDPDTRYSLWPPASPYGRTLVTTRRRDSALFGEGRRRIEVGLFTEAEAAAYLTKALSAQGREEPADQLTALACDLGHLPLALSQAAAYVIDSGLDTAAYRDLLADRATTLADTAPDRLPDEQAAAVAAAWSLSIDRADQLRPAGLARPMLHLAALFDANGIPQELLTSPPALTHLAQYRSRTDPGRARWWPRKRRRSPAPVTPKEAIGALRALYRLSLIDHTPATPYQAVRVHQLVQRATRDTLTPGELALLTRTAADALMTAWPEIERDTALAQALRANTSALTGHVEDALYRPDVHAVLYRIGNSLGNFGQVTAAINHFRHLVSAAQQCLGLDHPDALTARHNLAHWRGEAGDPDGAAAAFKGILTDCLRVLGPEHPHTLTAWHNLAHWRGKAGDAAGAAATLKEVLADCLRVLGPEHPHTLNIEQHLARWQGEAGDPDGAAAAFKGILADCLRVLGPEHPHTHTARVDFAHWRGEAGDAAGAAATLKEVLADCLRVLGPEHPHTLTARVDLAHWRGEAGDPDGAAAAFEGILTDCLRVLGREHPHTLNIEDHLARWQGKDLLPGPAGAPGDLAAAEELLANYLRVKGPDHLDTLDQRRYIASLREALGDAAGAAAALGELLTDYRRVLGPHHPDTLAARHHLAEMRGAAGDPAGAARVYEEMLADLMRVSADDHSDTLAARHQLARWRGAAGDPAGAVSAYEELLTDCRRVLGPHHPDTLAARHQLAEMRGAAGDPAGAASAFEALLTDRMRVLGDDHPDTLSTRASLARWRGAAGDPAGAVSAYEEMLALVDYPQVMLDDYLRTLAARHHLAEMRGAAGDPAGAVSAYEELLEHMVHWHGDDHPHTVAARHQLARWRSRAESGVQLSDNDRS